MENINIKNMALMTDSYKLSHWKQYPKGTAKIQSYLESRGGKFDNTLFFGLQYFLKEIEGVVVTMEDIEFANRFSQAHFGTDIFNKEGWEYIVKEHGGKLPIRIKAVKEGSIIPVGNVLTTIENTDDNCFWLTNCLETMLMRIWYPITVATNSYEAKKIIAEYLTRTGSNFEGLGFKLQDFGYRGVSSEETAGIGCMSHLVNFLGSDTLAGIQYANKFYNLSNEYKMYGNSVPASEHSVACSFGKNAEEEYFLNMLEAYPTGIVSIVSDTYDVFNFVKTMASKHKDRILSREGSVVFRPDSGDPVEINCGKKGEHDGLLGILWDIFGTEGSLTGNGYKLLPPQVRLIQGDGIDLDMIRAILEKAMELGFAADNFVFGSGGGLLQKFDRDTQKFAIKASYGERIENGTSVGFNIQKDPITSKGKKSKAGELKLIKNSANGKYQTVDKNNYQGTEKDLLELVFENGEIKRLQDFNEIRDIASDIF